MGTFFTFIKGGFYSESAIGFLDLQISKKKIFQKTILNLKFKIPAHNIILFWAWNFKFQVQDSFLEYFFFEIWRSKKRMALSVKKPPLASQSVGQFCLDREKKVQIFTTSTSCQITMFTAKFSSPKQHLRKDMQHSFLSFILEDLNYAIQNFL